MAVLFAIGFGAGIFSSCKTRKSESSLESQQEKFSAAAALEQVAQFTGRRTVDDWHLAGPDYENETDQRSDAARRGRDLWFFATGGNARFFHRTLPAKLGARIDWNRFLGDRSRGARFADWGAVNDPDCRAPRNEREIALSFGWDVCPGDLGPSGLFSHVGNPSLSWSSVDPACQFRERDASDFKERGTSCDLAFGTSTGVVGWRKFPNPNFRADRWPGWAGYRPGDHAVEPPFLIGAACAACHAGFRPELPPADSEKPQWKNIHGLVGNRFLRLGSVIGSGLPGENATRIFLEQTKPGTMLHFSDAVPLGDGRMKASQAIPLGVPVVFEGDEDLQHRMERSILRAGICSERCSLSDKASSQQCVDQCVPMVSYVRRIDDLVKYAEAVVSPELSEAQGMTQTQLIESIVPGGANVWEEGRKQFASRCASCHSGPSAVGAQVSWQKDDALQRDFFAKNRDGWREDALSDGGESTAISLGADPCGGREGLYRHTSLLGLWSKAPLLQSRSAGRYIASPSVAARLEAFDSALDVFLYPENREKTPESHSAPLFFEAEARTFAGDALSVLFANEQAPTGQVIKANGIVVPAGVPWELIRGLDVLKWSAAKLSTSERAAMVARAAKDPYSFKEIFGPWLRCRNLTADKGHERYLPEEKSAKEALRLFLKTL